jgi:hypothetical protein
MPSKINEPCALNVGGMWYKVHIRYVHFLIVRKELLNSMKFSYVDKIFFIRVFKVKLCL